MQYKGKFMMKSYICVVIYGLNFYPSAFAAAAIKVGCYWQLSWLSFVSSTVSRYCRLVCSMSASHKTSLLQ